MRGAIGRDCPRHLCLVPWGAAAAPPVLACAQRGGADRTSRRCRTPNSIRCPRNRSLPPAPCWTGRHPNRRRRPAQPMKAACRPHRLAAARLLMQGSPASHRWVACSSCREPRSSAASRPLCVRARAARKRPSSKLTRGSRGPASGLDHPQRPCSRRRPPHRWPPPGLLAAEAALGRYSLPAAAQTVEVSTRHQNGGWPRPHRAGACTCGLSVEGPETAAEGRAGTGTTDFPTL